jgi:hypothetical protein
VVLAGLMIDAKPLPAWPVPPSGDTPVGRATGAVTGPISPSACGQPRGACGCHNGAKFFLRTPGGRRKCWQSARPRALTRQYPQEYPQPAHSVTGVSAQAVHRPVHRTI